MRQLLLGLLVVLATISTNASASEYGRHDPKRVLTISDTITGKKFDVDLAYLDLVLNDLSTHAKNYPPQFDTPEDRQRATEDVKTMSGLLDILIGAPTPSPELLFRAGYLNLVGHNLDIQGSAAKADKMFRKLLAVTPSDARANFTYGKFLAGVGKSQAALPHLEKAINSGVVDAAYTMAMTYLALGEKDKSLRYLEVYKQHTPSDPRIDKLIDAIRSGNVIFERSSG